MLSSRMPGTGVGPGNDAERGGSTGPRPSSSIPDDFSGREASAAGPPSRRTAALVRAAVDVAGAGGAGRAARRVARWRRRAVRVGAVGQAVAVVVDAVVADLGDRRARGGGQERLHRRPVEGERAVDGRVVDVVARVVDVRAAGAGELSDDLARGVDDRRAAAAALGAPARGAAVDTLAA